MNKTSTCPKCNYINDHEEFTVCPNCSIIIKRYYEFQEKIKIKEKNKIETQKNNRKKYAKYSIFVLATVLAIVFTFKLASNNKLAAERELDNTLFSISVGIEGKLEIMYENTGYIQILRPRQNSVYQNKLDWRLLYAVNKKKSHDSQGYDLWCVEQLNNFLVGDSSRFVKYLNHSHYYPGISPYSPSEFSHEEKLKFIEIANELKIALSSVKEKSMVFRFLCNQDGAIMSIFFEVDENIDFWKNPDAGVRIGNDVNKEYVIKTRHNYVTGRTYMISD